MEKTIDSIIEELQNLDEQGSPEIARLVQQQEEARQELKCAIESMETAINENQFATAAEKVTVLKNRVLFYEKQLNRLKTEELFLKPSRIKQLTAELKTEAERLAKNTVEKITPAYFSIYEEYMQLDNEISKINTALHLLSRLKGESYCSEWVFTESVIKPFIENEEVLELEAFLHRRVELHNLFALTEYDRKKKRIR